MSVAFESANALWVAYDEDLRVSSVTASNGTEVSGITITEFEDAGVIKWFRGEDAAGISVQFGVQYESADEETIADVIVYRGQAGVEYGSIVELTVG